MNAILSPRRLSATVASGDALDVRHFHVAAEMSSLFEVSVVALSDNADIDLESVVGQPGSFSLHSDLVSVRTFSGIVRHFEQVAAEERGASTYRMSLVPAMWLLTQRRNHRMFQHESELDIVKKILGEWGITPVLRITGDYKKRKYKVQYGETDHAFVCRLLEDIGVSYFFDPEGAGELVLSDAPQTGAARAPLAFRDNPTQADREHATLVHVSRQVRPGKITVRDHDYRRPPSYKLMASAAGGAPFESKLESFHYAPGAFLFESDKGESTPSADDKGKYRTDEGAASKLAERRLAGKRATAKVVSFDTNVYDPGPGTVVTFLDHPRSDLAPGARFLVIESEMHGTHDGDWTCSLRAVSAEQEYHPDQRTPKPVAQGVESATVVGPAGEEIHTDEFGRVRVHFHWDRESKMDDSSSCWIHVSQPWSGTGFGGTNLPRVGQEVIVDFLGGDPDRPIIVGRVYTNLQKTPYKLPDSKTMSGLQSRSSPGGGGDNYNEMMFEDKKGQELLRMQAEKNLNKLVKNDEEVKIGRDRSKNVGRDDSLEVGQDRTRKVGRDENVEIGQDRTRQVGRDESVDIGRDETRNIAENADHTIGKNRTKQVGENEDIEIGQNQTLTVGENRTTEIGKVDSNATGDKIVLNISGGSGGTTTTMTDKKIVLTTGAGATLTMEEAKVTIEADEIYFIAKKKISSDAQSETFTVHAKQDIKLGSDQTMHLSTSAGIMSLSATGGDLKMDTNQNLVGGATLDVTLTGAQNFSAAASAGVATVSGKTQAVLTSPASAVVSAVDTVVEGTNATVTSTNTAVLGEAGVLVRGGVVGINP